MPDHYKEILANAPLVAIGMVVGQADALLERLPLIVKYTVSVTLAVSMFFSMKADIKAIETSQQVQNVVSKAQLDNILMQIRDIKEDDKVFADFMNRGDRCTKSNCDEIKGRILHLEQRIMDSKK